MILEDLENLEDINSDFKEGTIEQQILDNLYKMQVMQIALTKMLENLNKENVTKSNESNND